MIRFDIITIFPEVFSSFFNESIIKRAQDKDLIEINVHDLRDWTSDRHRTVDDRPFGGGIGMVLKIEPIYKAVQSLKSKVPAPEQVRCGAGKSQKSKVILFSPRGKRFNQKIASELSKLEQVIMICGRYEGVDERVVKYIADQNISIGNFVLMGGEVAAIAVVEAVSRLIPGVLGKPQFLKERITKQGGFLEYPQYTRPEVFKPSREAKWKVPKILLSGDHKKIEEWRKKHSKIIK